MTDAQMANQLRYTAVFEPAEEGGYIVTFPAIPGLATQGETLDEARVMAADCLRAYLESLRNDDEPLPYEAPEGPITERLTIDLARA
jgi:predicted RNase H-like HicB family nuclease